MSQETCMQTCVPSESYYFGHIVLLLNVEVSMVSYSVKVVHCVNKYILAAQAFVFNKDNYKVHLNKITNYIKLSCKIIKL